MAQLNDVVAVLERIAAEQKEVKDATEKLNQAKGLTAWLTGDQYSEGQVRSAMAQVKAAAAAAEKDKTKAAEEAVKKQEKAAEALKKSIADGAKGGIKGVFSAEVEKGGAGAFGGAALPIKLFTGLIAFGEAAQAMARKIVEANRPLAEFSGSMAMVMARKDAFEAAYKMRVGEATAAGVDRLERIDEMGKEGTEKVDNAFTNLWNAGVAAASAEWNAAKTKAAWVAEKTGVIDAVNGTTKAINNLSDMMNPALKAEAETPGLVTLMERANKLAVLRMKDSGPGWKPSAKKQF